VSEDRAAVVYAGALFAAAQDAGAVKDVRAQLADFAQAFATSPELRAALLDPQISRADKRRALTAVTAAGHPLLVNALHLLLVKGRMALLSGLAVEIERLAERATDVVEVEVTSAVPLAPAVERQLAARMQTATGRSVRLVKRVDAAIVGGLSVRIGDDVVVDASVRARAQQLRDRLTRASTRGAPE
jgi:F-type H+-transporting ATPase subunit delta